MGGRKRQGLLTCLVGGLLSYNDAGVKDKEWSLRANFASATSFELMVFKVLPVL